MTEGIAAAALTIGNLPAKDLLFLAVLVFAAALGLVCLRLGARVETLRRRNEELELDLASRPPSWPAQPVSPAQPEQGGDFEADLQQARMVSRLKGKEDVGDVPDKYRLLATLASRGVSGDDLNDALKILKISPAEAEQLIRLARLTQAGGARKD